MAGGSGVTLGFLKFVLGLDGLAFQEGLGLAEKQLKASQKRLIKIGDSFAGVGQAMTLALSVPLAGIGVAAVKGAQEQAAAMAQVEAALASMGPVAQRTSEQLALAADKLEMRSLYDAEVILKQVTANLLTFGNVAGKQFDRAQQAALDMATRLGGEPQAAAIMLGKALNDPVKGITALTRVGVQFTAAQKEQIATMTAAGNTAGAQGVILAEVERQFRGAAAAAADTNPYRKMQVALGQAGDKIGEALLPLIPPVTDAIVAMAQAFTSLSPAAQSTVLVVGGLSAAFGPLLLGVGSVVSAFGTMLPALTSVATFISATVVPVIATVGRALVGLAVAGGPITLVIGALTAAYLVWKNWETIGPMVQRLYQAVKTWLGDKLKAALEAVLVPIRAVEQGFAWLYKRVVGNSWVPDMVDGVAAHMAMLPAVMTVPANVAMQQVDAAFQGAAEDVGAANDNMVEGVRQSWVDIGRSVTNGVQSVVGAIRSGGILDVLGSLLDVFGQLGGAGVFGKRIQGNIQANGFGGFRAMGGPVVPGRSYVVGENGPEFFTPRARGFVTPGGAERGGGPISFDLRGAVMTADLVSQMEMVANVSGGRLIAANNANLMRRGRQVMGRR
jgi:hypothetical protein